VAGQPVVSLIMNTTRKTAQE